MGDREHDSSAGVVAWLQRDYGQLGRPAEAIAHALIDASLLDRVAYVQPQQGGRRLLRYRLRHDRGVAVHDVSGRPSLPPGIFNLSTRLSIGARRFLFLNCGVSEENLFFHRAFSQSASKTLLITHDLLHLWPGLPRERRRHLERVRSQLVEQSDLVIGLSEGSIEDIAGAFYVGHGCDHVWTSRDVDAATEPPDLSVIPRPRVIYLGFLGARIRHEALAALAASGVHVVLVGFEPGPGVRKVIDGNRNVHYLGSRRPSQAAAYLLHCDAGIVPHTDEPFTASMEPHKLYNFACAGLRSVTLHCVVPKALRSSVIQTASIERFVAATNEALALGRLPRDEMRAARTLSWARVARQIMALAAAH